MTAPNNVESAIAAIRDFLPRSDVKSQSSWVVTDYRISLSILREIVRIAEEHDVVVTIEPRSALAIIVRESPF